MDEPVTFAPGTIARCYCMLCAKFQGVTVPGDSESKAKSGVHDGLAVLGAFGEAVGYHCSSMHPYQSGLTIP